MKSHTRIYMDGMGFCETDFILCEVCGAEGKDIHHLVARRMGSTKKEYTVKGLMCLCRSCHIRYGDKKQYKEYLHKMHALAMIKEGKL